MEVGIRQGVCNDSPAEATGPENGWRCSDPPIPGRRGRASGAVASRAGREAPASRRERDGVRRRGLGVSLPGAAVGADLGGSSKYSGEILED